MKEHLISTIKEERSNVSYSDKVKSSNHITDPTLTHDCIRFKQAVEIVKKDEMDKQRRFGNCDDPLEKGMFEDADVKSQAHLCLKFDVDVF